ncbi:MAG: TetR family transcriptional regulator [Edaphobacter sp.]|nr:TetR family transcriptional regulator [Edaphobacter sp.]
MGNREALVKGAKQCLMEKGYARTTARDIASASGVSLAAIGYHFSSKDALLTEALMQAVQEWDDEFRRDLAVGVRQDLSQRQRFEAIWARLIKSFAKHRPLWAANFEMFSQIDHMPEIRAALGGSLRQAQAGLASLFLNIPEGEIDDETIQTMGALYYTLMTGLMAQHLLDPQNAMTAQRIGEAFSRVASDFVDALPRKRKRNTRS